MIKRLLKKIEFEVEIKLVWGHESNVGKYYRYPIKHLIKHCDSKARKKREEINSEVNMSNIKFYGAYNLKKEGIV